MKQDQNRIMGNNCSSCEATSVVTAKLIHEGGKLEEFPQSVRVSQVLQRNPRCFVCKAEDMDFDECVSAVDENERLQLGHLYFVLPASWLNKPLTTEQMVALAVKASAALKMAGGGGQFYWCGVKKVDPVIEWNSKRAVDYACPMAATIGGQSGRKSSSRLSARLSVILEE